MTIIIILLLLKYYTEGKISDIAWQAAIQKFEMQQLVAM